MVVVVVRYVLDAFNDFGLGVAFDGSHVGGASSVDSIDPFGRYVGLFHVLGVRGDSYARVGQGFEEKANGYSAGVVEGHIAAASVYTVFCV